MKAISVVRLLHSKASLRKLLCTIGVSGNERFLSTDSNQQDEPAKVEEAGTVNVLPPPTDKLLVLGGNGYIGSHVCREAVERGLSVASLSRSGRTNVHGSWADNVGWHRGDLLSSDALKDALNGVTSVISCFGSFGSDSHMYQVNGIANVNAMKAAAERGVKRFVYVSAADFGAWNSLLKLRGYYEGKKIAEAELLSRFPDGGVILKPGFVYGSCESGRLELNLGVIGAPLEMILRNAAPLCHIPFVGPLLIPPVNVTAIAKVAVQAAVDPVFPRGIVDVYGISRYGQQN